MNEAIKPQTLPKADDLDIDLDIADLHIDEKKDAPKALPVRDDNNLDSLGRMSAEAVTKQYESAAKAVESLRDDVRARIAMLQGAFDDCARDMKLITEAANAIREKGKQARDTVEKSSALSRQVRDACADLKKRVAVA